MSSFDFGLQLLDMEKMTYWGERRDANFWIENASVEWKESQAPFFTVGRLTLEPKSLISGASAEKVFFDVTRNASSDSAPVGRSIAPAGPENLRAERLEWASKVQRRLADVDAFLGGSRQRCSNDRNGSIPAFRDPRNEVCEFALYSHVVFLIHIHNVVYCYHFAPANQGGAPLPCAGGREVHRTLPTPAGNPI